MTETNEPIQMMPKIHWWGKHSGGFYDHMKPKGASQPWGLCVKIKKWGAGHENQGPAGRKRRWYQGRFGQKPKTTHKTATPQQSLKLVEKKG